MVQSPEAWSLPFPHSGSGEVHTSQWPRASHSRSHVGGMSGHSLKTSVVLCCSCWWLSLVWLGASGGCLCFSLAFGFLVVSSLGGTRKGTDPITGSDLEITCYLVSGSFGGHPRG